MFERFTDRARQAVVLAQDEARVLQHNYIGTEHLLLGLIHEGDGVAARALESLDVSLEAVRREVIGMVGTGKRAPSGHIPFTPRAKKSLEFALREALRFGHNYIGTEHVLLGLLREGDGVAAQVLVKLGADLDRVREAVVQELHRSGMPLASRPAPLLSRLLRRRAPGSPAVEEPQPLPATPAAESGLAQLQRLAQNGPVASQHLLLAAIVEPTSVAARCLAAAGVDLDGLRETLEHVDVAGTADDLPEQAGRRGMTLRLTDHSLLVEITDPIARDAARGAFGGRGELHGEEPGAAGLADVWLALISALRRAEGGDDQTPSAA